MSTTLQSSTTKTRKANTSSLLAPAKGLMETTVYIKSLLQEIQPRFAAMTGICAGDKTRVSQQDLIVAECTYIYDSGKIFSIKKNMIKENMFLHST